MPQQSFLSARVSRPPVLPDHSLAEFRNAEQLSVETEALPPTYNQVRSIARPEIARLLLDGGASSIGPPPLSSVSPAESLPSDQLTSCNVVSLEDIRHDIGHHIHLKNRISVVPDYPVYQASPAPSIRVVRRSMRPASIASTSTARVFLSLGQLPGVEPFDLEPLAQDILDQHDGIAAQPQSIQSSVESGPSVYETAVRVQIRKNTAPSNNSSRLHTTPLDEPTPGSPRDHSNGPATGLYAPHVANLRSVRTWPVSHEIRTPTNALATNHRGSVTHHTGESEIPPRPPPKDSRYLSKPGSGGIRPSRFPPMLPPANSGIISRHATATSQEASRVGEPIQANQSRQARHHKTWLSGISFIIHGGNDNNNNNDNNTNTNIIMNNSNSNNSKNHRTQSRGRLEIPASAGTSREAFTQSTTTTSRLSHLLDACARILGRAIPRIAVGRGS